MTHTTETATIEMLTATVESLKAQHLAAVNAAKSGRSLASTTAQRQARVDRLAAKVAAYQARLDAAVQS
jgi:uncharacterized protein YceH (UPF0502 family)